MSGAGAATVAYALEDSYLGGVSNPTYRLPGRDLRVDRAELSRNVKRLLAPGDIEAQDFIAQRLEGQLSVSFVLSGDEFHRLLFNDNATGFASGAAPSAEWYLGAELLSETAERRIKGWVPMSGEISYSGSTELVRVTLTGPYGDEELNTTLTPGTIERPSTAVPGHGLEFSVGGQALPRVQSVTLSFEQLSRLRRGADQRPLDAVVGDVQTTVDVTTLYDGPELYEQILGAVDATTTQETVQTVPATATFDAGGTTVATYDIARVAPDTYGWDGLVDNEADLEESINYLGAGVTASDPTTT